MAVDIQRDIASHAPTRRHWWERIFTTRDAALRPRAYVMTGIDTRALDATRPLMGNELGLPANAEVLVLTAETALVRYGVGFTPTAAYGNPLPAGTSIILTLTDPDSLALIAGAAGSGAVAHIQAYRVGGI